MKIGINVNLKRDINAQASKLFCKKLKEHNIEYMICDTAKELFANEKVASMQEIAQWCQIIVAFGGDGTMLNTVHNLDQNIPILGINMGKIGFLTEIDESEIDFAVECLISGKYTIEDRTLLKTIIDDTTYYAMNEIVVSRQDPCHISAFDIEIDDTKADRCRSDGVLVSTPTGSTAYSLSCNGPVLSPTVKALIINAICPHSMHSCPMVVDDNMKIRIMTECDEMRVVVDGIVVAKTKNGINILIEKAQRKASFIRLKKDNFYKKLLDKLNNWGN